MPSLIASLACLSALALGVCLLPAADANQPQEDAATSLIRQFRLLQGQAAEKRKEATELATGAHRDLDAARYQDAVANHRKSRVLEEEADRIQQQIEDTLVEFSNALLQHLSHETFARREEATAALMTLGPRVLPILSEVLRRDPDPETKFRIKKVLTAYQGIEIDDRGQFLQWAAKAEASTQYGEDSWSAMQATGKPDTPVAGDKRTAWAPSTTDRGEEWLELRFKHPVVPSMVRIHETYNPGTVVKVEARDKKGRLRVLWQGEDTTKTAPAFFEVKIPKEAHGGLRSSVIRITLDTKLVGSYNEIDAVQLVGSP